MKTILPLLIICGLLSSCDCKDFDQISISERNIPDTVLNFEDVQIMVQAEAYNGCWGDLLIELRKNEDFTYSIKAFGTKSCCTCICPAVLVHLDTLINFKPTEKGTYFFRIWETPKNSIIDTMIVE